MKGKRKLAYYCLSQDQSLELAQRGGHDTSKVNRRRGSQPNLSNVHTYVKLLCSDNILHRTVVPPVLKVYRSSFIRIPALKGHPLHKRLRSLVKATKQHVVSRFWQRSSRCAIPRWTGMHQPHGGIFSHPPSPLRHQFIDMITVWKRDKRSTEFSREHGLLCA